MERKYKTFEELRDNAEMNYSTFAPLPWDYMSEKGIIARCTWNTLVDIFEFSTCKADVVEMVASEIRSNEERLAEKDGCARPDEVRGITDILKRYVRFNFERELWQDMPEFKRKEK